jgi:hypothetical protein
LPSRFLLRGEWYWKRPGWRKAADAAGDQSAVSPSTRKLIGTIAMLVLLVSYVLVAMVLVSIAVEGAPWWLAVIYAAVAGLLWIVPAALLIRWMVRP